MPYYKEWSFGIVQTWVEISAELLTEWLGWVTPHL